MAQALKKLQKLVLRLDDGTLIKAADHGEGGEAPATAAVLKPAEAYNRGSLTEAHLLKAQALLCEVHAKLPEEGPLRSLSLGSKRSVDTGYHHPEVGPADGGRRNGSGRAGWAAAPARTSAAMSGASPRLMSLLSALGVDWGAERVA